MATLHPFVSENQEHRIMNWVPLPDEEEGESSVPTQRNASSRRVALNSYSDDEADSERNPVESLSPKPVPKNGARRRPLPAPAALPRIHLNPSAPTAPAKPQKGAYVQYKKTPLSKLCQSNSAKSGWTGTKDVYVTVNGAETLVPKEDQEKHRFLVRVPGHKHRVIVTYPTDPSA